MELYELINPSDCVTFHAPSNQVAIAVSLLVGRGQYPARRCSDDTSVGGLLLFATEEQTEAMLAKWFVGVALEAWIDAHRDEVIAALEDCATMSVSDRQTYDAACAAITEPSKLATFKAEVQDKKRTSMNDISGYAWKMAAKMRGEKPKDDVRAPFSVMAG
jgi:hypothetical protein